MKSKVLVVIPAIVSKRILKVVVNSVKKQTLSSDILIVQNGSEIDEVCKDLEQEGVNIYRPYDNLGCSASWNYGMKVASKNGYSHVLLLNDDLEFNEDTTLERLYSATIENPKAHHHVCGYSAVMISCENWELVGPFDEGFYPAYYEDNDYYQRSIAEGIGWEMLLGVDYTHLQSFSSKTSPQVSMLLRRTTPLNLQRYIAKWGGEPHHEGFKYPWNGGEPTFGNVKDILREQGWTKFYD